jgi:hypothetical protein
VNFKIATEAQKHLKIHVQFCASMPLWLKIIPEGNLSCLCAFVAIFFCRKQNKSIVVLQKEKPS